MLKNAFKHVGFLGFFFLLSAVNTYPLILSPGSKILNYTLYPWQHGWWFNSWLVSHGPDIIQSILSGSFFLDSVFYPLGTPTSLYGQSLFATIISQPFLRFFPLAVVVNMLIILSLGACGYAAFLLGGHLFKKDCYGLIAGCIFCSSPILIAQAKSHFIVLTTIFAIPLYILYLIKTTETPNLKHSFFLSVSATVLASGYLYFLNTLFIFTVIFLILQSIHRKIHLIQIIYYFIAFLLFIPSLVFIFSLLFQGPGFSIGVNLTQVRFESVDMLAFFLPDVDHPILGSFANEIRRHFLNNPVLHSVYLGIPVLAFSVLCIKSSYSAMKLWILSALIFTLLSLGPVVHFCGKAFTFGLSPESGGYMPYMMYYMLFRPFVVSDCSMFFILAMLFWAILASSGIKNFVANSNKRNRTALLIGILCLMAFDYVGIPHPTLQIPDSHAFTSIREDLDKGSILNLPYRNDMISYLYIQNQRGKKMLNPGFPRRLDSDFFNFGDNFPAFVKLKEIKNLSSQNLWSADLKAASDFQWFFDLKYIIIHKLLLKEDEVLSNCRDFIVRAFSAVPVYEDGSFLILKLKSLINTDRPQMMIQQTIDFNDQDRNSIFSGWSYPEKDDSGRTWRWSDRKQSVLILKIDVPEDIIMRCNLDPFIDGQNKKQTLTVFLNGGELMATDLSEGWRPYDICVPASQLRIGHNRFTFSYGYVGSPLEKGINNDARSLAVAFDSIEFIHP